MIYLMKIIFFFKFLRNLVNLILFLLRIVGKEFGRLFIRLLFIEWE